MMATLRTARDGGRRRKGEQTSIVGAVLIIFALLWTLIGAATTACGQDVGEPPSETEVGEEPAPSDELTLQRLEARVAELEQIAEPGEAEQAELTQLRSAVAALRQAIEAEAQAAQFQELMRTAPDRLKQINEELKQIEAELAKPAGEAGPPPDADTTLQELNAQLESARTQLEAARKLKSDVEAEFARRDERRAQIAEEIAACRQQLEAIESSLAAGADPADPPRLAEAKRANLLAQKRALEANLNRLDQEARSYEARKALITARLERARGRVTVAERPFTALQKRVDAKRTAAAEQARRQAEAARREAASAHQVVREITDENADLTNELADISARTRDRNAERARVTELYTRWNEAFEAVRAQIEQVGLTGVVGLRLRSYRAQLPDLAEHRRRLRELRDEMRRVQSQRFELDAKDFEDAGKEAQRRLRESEAPVPQEEREAILQATTQALEKQKEYLAELESAYDLYFDPTLVELHRAEEQLLQLIDSSLNFIDERVLWIQSAAPIVPADAKRAVDALEWLTSPDGWRQVLEGFWGDLKSHPLPLPLGLVGFIVLLLARRPARRRLREIDGRVMKVTTDRFGLTAEALLLTILLAAPWPSVIWLLAWRLADAPQATDFSAAIASGLARLGTLLFAAEMLRQLCRRQGLADGHLRWRRPNLDLVRRHLRWLMAIALPLAFIFATTAAGESTAHHHALGRLAFIGAMIALAAFAQRLLRPSEGVLGDLIAAGRGGWIDRLRYVWFPAIVLAPLALGILAALGYFYTAAKLEQRVLVTIWVVLLIVVGHALFMRWLYVIQRRLAFQQALKRREARIRERAEAQETDAGAEPPAPAETEEELEIDVAAVSAQSRSLVRSVAVFAAFVGILLIWADVLPAFRILDNVELWSESTTVSEAAGEGASDEATTSVSYSAITLADLGISLIVLIFTVVFSRNIPGLLEITVLQRLPFTPGARYATTTLVRYTIVIVGIVLAFNAIGVGWSKVQWLAAAITVGLGFGLQEIFANFVSGIIILFERPIRVGDTVTVGEVSGSVSRIRMRATTITDWDRKELIIPNKEFVTGQIINWSLSDSTIRIIITVGVAYGSNTELAKKLLLKVAREHKRVLDEPAPRALFLGFGDSALNLDLRVYVPHIDYFLATRDDLHSAIDAAFREAGIEIAFPQRDIHVRSVKADFPVQMRAGETGETGQ
ncbi:MAG: mechanosensitive ion channel [Planctomycetota bacterium]|nr:mechanosensitive ion channel [Planctomycetota bacterium]